MLYTARFLTRLFLLLIIFGTEMRQSISQTIRSSNQITTAALQSRMSLIENSIELTDSMKTKILEQYQQSLSNMELAKKYGDRKKALKESFRRAPIEIETIRKAIRERKDTDQKLVLQINDKTSDEELEDLLEQELIAISMIDSRLKNLELSLEQELQQPDLVRSQIINAKLLLEETKSQDVPALGIEASPLVLEARNWLLQTKVLALEAEISMFDQELLGNRSQVMLIHYQTEETEQIRTHNKSRLEFIQNAARGRRLQGIELARNKAKQFLELDTTSSVVLKNLAEDNLRLITLQEQQVEALDAVDSLDNHYRMLSIQVANTFLNTKRKLELRASRTPLGRIIREERAGFPNRRSLEKEKWEMDQFIALVSLRLIQSEEKRRAMSDLDAYLENLLEDIDGEDLDAKAQADFIDLASTQLDLLDRTISDDNNLERKLYTYNELLEQLIGKLNEYDDYLGERLLWVKSTSMVQKSTFINLNKNLKFFLLPGNWNTLGQQILIGFKRNPVLLLLLLLFTIFFLQRKRFLNALSTTGNNVRRVLHDHIYYSINALIYTFLIALPIPLLLWTFGESLIYVSGQDLFSHGIFRGLHRGSYFLLYLLFIRALFLPGGVADHHLGWPKEICKKMRRLLGLFIGIGLPLYFLIVCFGNFFPTTMGGGLSILFFTAYMASLSWFAFAFLHPSRGMIRFFLQEAHQPLWWRWRHTIFTFAFIIPILLTIFGWLGYTHTALEFYSRLEYSAWLFIVLWLASIIGERWLLILQSNLLHEALQQERKTAIAATQEGGSKSSEFDHPIESNEESRAEINNLDSDTRELFNATIILTMVLGLIAIWGEVLPAFGILKDINLWQQTVLIEGVQSQISTTLADLLKAILYGVIAYVLGKNLPSLVNIILIRRGSISPGGRYAISSLMQYSIALFGTLIVLGKLGVNGAQLGWAAAALGVGIGFGLQEIVANFISGIILLFERPVRIGDVVTIGEASGVVTRIDIRATTIRDWEKKELLVPNKELITGRLLNWTLSDQITRIQVRVGVAYGSDLEKARLLMMEAAENNERVLVEPPPFAFIEQLGDSSINLTLNIFVGELSDRIISASEIINSIKSKFEDAGIKIPFPQRDINIIPQKNNVEE